MPTTKENRYKQQARSQWLQYYVVGVRSPTS